MILLILRDKSGREGQGGEGVFGGMYMNYNWSLCFTTLSRERGGQPWRCPPRTIYHPRHRGPLAGEVLTASQSWMDTPVTCGGFSTFTPRPTHRDSDFTALSVASRQPRLPDSLPRGPPSGVLLSGQEAEPPNGLARPSL